MWINIPILIHIPASVKYFVLTSQGGADNHWTGRISESRRTMLLRLNRQATRQPLAPIYSDPGTPALALAQPFPSYTVCTFQDSACHRRVPRTGPADLERERRRGDEGYHQTSTMNIEGNSPR